MLDILFYIFSAIMLVSAIFMVVMPNAVNGAMCMIVSFLSTAVLFVLLESYFLAIIQVLVYAGAVMVLFLFIIMLLDPEKEGGLVKHKDVLNAVASVIGFALFVLLICSLVSSGELPEPAQH